jgi:hypothetical protein
MAEELHIELHVVGGPTLPGGALLPALAGLSICHELPNAALPCLPPAGYLDCLLANDLLRDWFGVVGPQCIHLFVAFYTTQMCKIDIYGASFGDLRRLASPC